MWSKIKSALGLGELGEVTKKMEADHQDARKRFVWCVLAISPGSNADPGYRPAFASKAIREWYGLESRKELLDNIDFYIEGTGSTPGYDCYRGIFQARAGLGASMISEAESWEACFRVVRKLKQSYPSWNTYASGYIEGHLDYRREQGDDSDTLAQYRRNIIENVTELTSGLWARTPYETPV